MIKYPSPQILEASFAANPNYELVLFDRLPAEQREVLKDLSQDPDFYGVLRPRAGSGLSTKSVSRDSALLFLTLQQPGPLPAYVQATLGDRCNQEIARLVLDGVLGIQHEGRLLCGSEAASLLLPEPDSNTISEPEAFLARLSREALRYGQSLRLTDAMALSARLYGYNRYPLSPYWSRTLGTRQDAAAAYLGIGEGIVGELLNREWRTVTNPMLEAAWLVWQSRRTGSVGSFGRRTGIACKLYVSPKPEELPKAFPVIVATFSRVRVHSFKVGRDALGLLRADKIVAYFASFTDMLQAAEQLQHDLQGCPAQGVPFTAELSGDGLLSCGIDPPAERHTVPWIGPESWRLWVTNRLAVALIAASRSGTERLEPFQFALRRLQLEGVDTATWMPAGTQPGEAVAAGRR